MKRQHGQASREGPASRSPWAGGRLVRGQFENPTSGLLALTKNLTCDNMNSPNAPVLEGELVLLLALGFLHFGCL